MKLLIMPLPTESPCGASPISVGVRDGERGSPTHSGLSAVPDLPVWIQEMRYCERCESEQIFLAAWMVETGYLGYCVGCGAESVMRWTRTNSEAC